ncbi:GDYXXLXY domain-containing protein [Novispirillum itersonii]|uniref:Putative membrane-anchored protein n=1 Tax=Novispirillum itersonii TaxID=189 RepID=A0A7X0DMX8_NOVIT|nr:GDYXXLXY domain-containing protein [Novispirillum itersonii]MBB6211548.1 putative membrane-anchored protein [Novispirillum itersonii]
MTGVLQAFSGWLDRRRWQALAAVVAILTAAIPAQALWREWLLHHGTVVRLQAVPVDPWDLFRGAYVTLNYAVLQADLTALPGTPAVLAAIGPMNDGPAWLVVSADAPDHPLDLLPQPPAAPAAGTVALAVWVDRDEGERLTVTLPSLERYYLAPDPAKAMEGEVRAGRLSVEAAVAADGTPALRGLWVDGEKVADERLFGGGEEVRR